MKTIADLFQLVGLAVAQNNKHKHWFVDYSGHVDKISVRVYNGGWDGENPTKEMNTYLTEDGIQLAYWFVKNNL